MIFVEIEMLFFFQFIFYFIIFFVSILEVVYSFTYLSI
jgi:hypothetical protein